MNPNSTLKNTSHFSRIFFLVVYFILTPHPKVGNAIIFVLYIQYQGEGELESLDDDSSSNRLDVLNAQALFLSNKNNSSSNSSIEV